MRHNDVFLVKEIDMNVTIASTMSIKKAGFDEYWLQKQIYENPACLGLGDLEAVRKERSQASGGRLDILLKDPEDDSMYEVEIMLGQTDESHIIRTIEYWDNEKRRWPQRQHYAVLVAESITKRFFNVIHLFSNSIPIIAIQVNMIEANSQKMLHFTKILDTYEEPDDGIEEVHDEAYWRKRSICTLETAKELISTIGNMFESPTLRYLKGYIAVNISGNNYFWFHKRAATKSLFGFRIADEYIEEVSKLLDDQDVCYMLKNSQYRLVVDTDFIKTHADLLKKIAERVQDYWRK